MTNAQRAVALSKRLGSVRATATKSYRFIKARFGLSCLTARRARSARAVLAFSLFELFGTS